MSGFFNMGGYGFYIWISYGLAFCFILASILHSVYRTRKINAQKDHKNTGD